MPDQLPGFGRDVYEAGSPVVVVSPHLDDAVLSCGALLASLARRCPVTIVTVFTAASPRPWSLPARRALRAAGVTDAEQFYALRRAEDQAVVNELGAVPVHLGLRDALFRRFGDAGGRRPRWARWPVYPTFRFDAAVGRVAAADTTLAADLSARLDGIVRAGEAGEAGLVLAPLGVGRHVDHVITRSAARRLRSRVVYYSDFPYSQTQAPDQAFVRRASLTPRTWLAGRAENARLIAGYRTQFTGLFPDGTVPLRPEVYWDVMAASRSAATM